MPIQASADGKEITYTVGKRNKRSGSVITADNAPMFGSIDNQLKDLARKATLHDELQPVLSSYLSSTRDLRIMGTPERGFMVLRCDGGYNTKLHESQSYTACVEFALKQPAVENKGAHNAPHIKERKSE